jgi:antitoxin (DNA-binding transcriptional repressor) of toxin-antitoxin stability system
MRRVNLRQLHHETGRIIAAVAEGETILIERRGSVVAELRPVEEEPATPLRADRWTRLPHIPGDITDAIAEDREGR